MHANKRPRDVYSEITQEIVKAIESGAASFEMPWHKGSTDLPLNAKTKKHYSGINILSLWVAELSCGYSSNLWATYKQWKDLDAQVRKGEKGNLVVFYKELAREPEHSSNEPEAYFVARASRVFNANQVDNYHPEKPQDRSLVDIVAEADETIKATSADIRHGGNRAFYMPSNDYIQMPDIELFTGTQTRSPTESYYSVLFHELSHWTGHENRLERDTSNRFGDQGYAMEELVAELGAAYLCCAHSITNTPRPDHAAYISNWLEVLKLDKKAIFDAASKASKASDYVLQFRGGES